MKKCNLGWMYSDHYHCKKCKAVIRYIDRLSWTPFYGVRAVGICKHCAIIVTEFEYLPFLRYKSLGVI